MFIKIKRDALHGTCMLYTYTKESLQNYKSTLENPETCDYTDTIITCILKEAIEGNTSYTYVFDRPDTFVDIIVSNLRKVFCDSIVLHYKHVTPNEITIQNAVIVDWS